MKGWQAPSATVRRFRWSKAVTAIACLSEQMRPRAPFTGHGRVHAAVRVLQALVTSRGSLASASLVQGVMSVWPTRPHAVAWAGAVVLLGGCADLSEFRTDITRLRADLHAHAQGLAQLSARMDELERRQGEAESAAQRTQQDLSRGLEVRLRKAPIPTGQQITRDAGKRQSPKP